MRALIAVAVCAVLAACSGGGQPTARSTPSGPATTYPVPDACGLITQADVVAVAARGVPPVTVEFVGEPNAQTAADSNGPYSRCSRSIRSNWPGLADNTTKGGLVGVRYQTGGASEYFPVHGGDVAVSGLGDEAMIRDRSVYVRVGAEVLLVQASIATRPRTRVPRRRPSPRTSPSSRYNGSNRRCDHIDISC